METVKEMSSKDMHRTEISSEGRDRMKDSRDVTIRMEEGITKEMSRTTKKGKSRIIGHSKEATMNKSRWIG